MTTDQTTIVVTFTGPENHGKTTLREALQRMLERLGIGYHTGKHTSDTETLVVHTFPTIRQLKDPILASDDYPEPHMDPVARAMMEDGIIKPSVPPLQRLFNILAASDCSKSEMGGIRYIGWQTRDTIERELFMLRDQLGPHIHDLSTHYTSWRKMLTRCIEVSRTLGAGSEDTSYLEHELKAFDQLFGALAGVSPERKMSDLPLSATYTGSETGESTR